MGNSCGSNLVASRPFQQTLRNLYDAALWQLRKNNSGLPQSHLCRVHFTPPVKVQNVHIVLIKILKMQKALQCKKHFGVNPSRKYIKTHKIRIFQQRALIEHLRKVGFTRETDIVRPIGPILDPFQIKLSVRADRPSIWGRFDQETPWQSHLANQG